MSNPSPFDLLSSFFGEQPKQPELPPLKPWKEIADQLDKNLPREDYDKIRLNYFATQIRPRMQPDSDVNATYQEFLKNSERPVDVRMREFTRSVGRATADLAAQGVGLVAAGEILGPIVGMANRALLGERALSATAAKIATGGLTFATVDALQAKEGDRVHAAIRGAGIGVLTEAGLSALFAHSDKAAEALLKKAMTEKVAPEAAAPEAAATAREAPAGAPRDIGIGAVERAATAGIQLTPEQLAALKAATLTPEQTAEILPRAPTPEAGRMPLPFVTPSQEQLEAMAGSLANKQEVGSKIVEANVKEARRQGMTTGPIVINPAVRGVDVTVRDAKDIPRTLKLQAGKEAEVIGQVEEILGKGGSIDGVHAHPNSQARAVEFMRHFAEKAEFEDQPFRMRVPKGMAREQAAELNAMGLRSTVVNDSLVNVGSENPQLAAQRAAQRAERIKQQQAGRLVPPTPDDMSKKMMRIGELRNQIRLAVDSPPEIHDELHHLTGDVGEQYQLTRSQVGQLGLDYWDKNAGADAPASAIPALEKYAGRGVKYGVVKGERPPLPYDKESRLRGFLDALPESEKTAGVLNDLDVLMDLHRDLGPTMGELRERPTGKTFLSPMTSEEMGAKGGQIIDPYQGPVRVFPTDWTKGTLAHESFHDGVDHAGLTRKFVPFLDGHQDTYLGIMKGLREEFPNSYGKMDMQELANEVMAHTYQAFRDSDPEKLAQLVEWDTSREHVEQMANEVAGRLYEASMTKDTAPIRAFQRRMNDLVRRTSPNVADTLAKAQFSGYTTWFDPEIASWVMRDGEGREVLKNSLDEVHNAIENADPSSHFPDIMHNAFHEGLKGPGGPPGTDPVDGTVTMESEAMPLVWNPLGPARPTLDWAAGIQGTLDKFGIQLNFYDRIADADAAGARSFPITDKLDKDLTGILKDVPFEQRSSYGEVLRTPDTQWQAMATAHKLSVEDLSRIALLRDWSEANVKEGGVSLTDTLRDLHAVRAAGGDIQKAGLDPDGAVAKAIKGGHLGVDNLQVGQVARWVIRQSMNDRFMTEALKPVEDLLKEKALSSPIVQWPLRNYINTMKGLPDTSQKMLNTFFEGVERSANAKIAELNKGLPKNMQINPLSPPRELMSKWLLFQRAAGLGGRPAVFFRDSFAALQAGAVMGPSAFAEGLKMSLTPEGHQMALDAGAMITHRTIGQAFGDLTGDLPVSGRRTDWAVKFAEKLMWPSTAGHNFGRKIAYLGEYQRAVREIGKFRAGAIDALALRDATSVYYYDKPLQSRLLAMAADPKVPLEEAAKRFGLALNDNTQFALRQGTQPALLRTGLGKIFGQYGTWPANYMEMWRKFGQAAITNPRKGIPAAGLFLVIQYGAFETAKSLGIDAAKWLFFSPAGYLGSPNLELVQNILAAPEESQAGLEARRKLHEAPLEFVPGGVEVQNILRSMQDGEVDLARLMGFRKLPQKEAQDWEDWLEIEGGFKRQPRTRQ